VSAVWLFESLRSRREGPEETTSVPRVPSKSIDLKHHRSRHTLASLEIKDVPSCHVEVSWVSPSNAEHKFPSIWPTMGSSPDAASSGPGPEIKPAGIDQYNRPSQFRGLA